MKLDWDSPRTRWGLLGLWSLLVVVFFLKKAPVSLKAGWTHDDLMNCYRAVEFSWQRQLADLAMFWRPTPFFRPLGQLFYRALFDTVGWDPRPYRWLVSALMVGNAFLIGHLVWRWSKSIVVGMIAMIFAVYHPHWIYLYLNTGTVFEILAAFLVWLGVVVHVETREWRVSPLLVAVIFVLGLNAKESAVLLPVLVVLYELVWHQRVPWKQVVLLGGIAGAFIAGRVYGPEGLASVGMYQPKISFAMYAQNFTQYFRSLLLLKWGTGAMYAIACLAPVLLRSRLGVMAGLVFPLGILPLAFVPERGLDSVIVAAAWIPLTAAALLEKVRGEERRLAVAALVFALVAWFVPARKTFDGMDQEFRDIRVFREDLLRLEPNMPGNIQVRFEKEPFPEEYPWGSTFLTRLAYREMTIDVVAPNNPHTKDWSRGRDWAVFTWEEGRLKRLR